MERQDLEEVSAMKVRVKWTKTGVLKFIGHLDVQRYFQKALMRAELPVSFSKGMSPHQIMSFAAPLGLGMTSEGEYADISFDWSYSSEEMLKRINAVMNEGISVLEFKEIDEKEKNCMAVTEAADYLVTFREGYYYKDALGNGAGQGVQSFLLDQSYRVRAKNIANNCIHVSLAENKKFMESYIKNMNFSVEESL